ncbi:27339_t:CDS:1, partial [Racocetra persica]
NDKGEEVQVCKVVDENSIKYSAKYKNIKSSTRNLIIYLRNIHEIILQNEVEV